MVDIAAAKAALDRHLRQEEGERLKPYLCQAKVPTIGVGATTYPDGRKVRLSDPPITVARMNEMLAFEIDTYVTEVLDMVDNQCTTNQLIALVLCAYNIGLPRLRTSTIMKRHREGDHPAAARAFRLFNKYRPNGPGTPLQVHPVLEARRAREAALYLTPDEDDEAPPLRPPQAVEGESNLAKSPMTISGAASLASGVILSVSQAGESLSSMTEPLRGVKTLFLDTLGIPVDWFLPMVLVGVGVAVMYWRSKQREEGWA